MVSLLMLKRKKRRKQVDARKWRLRPWIDMREAKGQFHFFPMVVCSHRSIPSLEAICCDGRTTVAL